MPSEAACFFIDVAFAGLALANRQIGGFGGAIEKFINALAGFHDTGDAAATHIKLQSSINSLMGLNGDDIFACRDRSTAQRFAGIDGGSVLQVLFSGSKVVVSPAAGSFKQETVAGPPGGLSDRTRDKIDDIFMKNPRLAQTKIWIGISRQVFTAASSGASCGAMSAGNLLNALALNSSKMSPNELEGLIWEGLDVKTVLGVEVQGWICCR